MFDNTKQYNKKDIKELMEEKFPVFKQYSYSYFCRLLQKIKFNKIKDTHVFAESQTELNDFKKKLQTVVNLAKMDKQKYIVSIDETSFDSRKERK